MKLTDDNKKVIDDMGYEELLRRWRFTPSGDPWFEGETGKYWQTRMNDMRAEEGGQERHVAASKLIGW